MANYYGTGRSNYFRVKNAVKFLEWAAGFSGIKVTAGQRKNTFCVFGDEETGGLPTGTDEEDGVEFMVDIAQHLSKGSVAIFLSAGNEKLRYVEGWAFAINSEGKQETINIDHIYEMAKKLTTKPITRAEY